MKKFTPLFILCAAMLLCGFSSGEAENESRCETKLSAYTQHVLNKKSKTERSGARPQITIDPEVRKSTRAFVDLDKSFVTVGGTEYLKAFIKLTPGAGTGNLEQLGVRIHSTALHHSSSLIPVAQLQAVLALDEVEGIEAARPVFQTLNQVRTSSNVTPIHSGTPPLTRSYYGEGVIVGVVDEGFDLTHPNYYDLTGTVYRVQKLWSQVATTGTPPSGYSTGAEYTTAATIQAVGTDNSNETHGTHTSGIAAGSGYGTNGNYTGIAPKSDIILVATDMSTTGIMDGIQYIINNAKAAGKPCAINLSLGSEVGPHDGTSAEDQMVDNLAGEGVIVVGAAGNSGLDSLHIQKVFTSGATQSVNTFLAPSATGTTEMIADIWGRNNSVFGATLQIYNASSLTPSYTSPTVQANQASAEYSYTSPLTGQTYTLYLIPQLYSGNGDYNIMAVVEASSAFNSQEYVVLNVSGTQADTINIWATNGIFRNYNQSGFTAGNTDYTVGAVGGVGRQVISVGAYCTKNQWTDVADQGIGYTSGANLWQIAPFSSMGPTADQRLKPDIAAPGFGVVSGFNSYDTEYGASNNTTVATATFKGKSYYWGVDQGTSMACPVITGTMALWLEAYPKLTPAMAKQIFSEYSFLPDATRALTQSNIWGWGKVDALSGMEQAIALGVEEVTVDSESSLTLFPNPASEEVRISSKSTILCISLSDLSGRVLVDRNLTEKVSDYTLHLNDVTPGIYLLRLQTENGKLLSKLIVR